MSKIGKLPVKLPEGTEASFEGSKIKISGPKGELSLQVPNSIEVKIEGGSILLTPKGREALGAIYGTIRSEIANMVSGVSDGWVKELELVGTGYRGEVSGNALTLTVGYSHPVKIEAPDGVSFKIEKTMITVSGLDREVVGQIAANIRAVRPPEPYKGKGIKYKDEVIRRKAGKAAKVVGAPGAGA